MPAKKETSGRMRGGVRKRGPGGKWSYVLDLGLQPAQRCESCSARLWLGRDKPEACPACGGRLRATIERRQLVQGGFKTRNEAVAARAKRVGTLQDGAFVEPTKLTLASYLRDVFLPAYKGMGKKAATVSSWESLTENHLIGPDDEPYAIGLTPLQKLTRAAIQAHYADLAVSGLSRGTGGLSPASVQRVHAALSRALNYAVKNGYLSASPAKGIAEDLPKAPSGSQGAQKAWTGEQLAAFLDAIRDDELYPLWRLIGSTGLRRGEALGLRVTDFNAELNRISVRRNRVPVGKEVVENETKTESCRVVSIDPQTAKILREHLKGSTGEYLFTDHQGEPLDPNRVSRAFTAAVALTKLPTISVHGLRHTHISMGLEAGVSLKVMSVRAGHKSVAMTGDVYSHVLPEQDDAAAAKIADLIR